jgi:hypothetical protein
MKTTILLALAVLASTTHYSSGALNLNIVGTTSTSISFSLTGDLENPVGGSYAWALWLQPMNGSNLFIGDPGPAYIDLNVSASPLNGAVFWDERDGLVVVDDDGGGDFGDYLGIYFSVDLTEGTTGNGIVVTADFSSSGYTA